MTLTIWLKYQRCKHAMKGEWDVFPNKSRYGVNDVIKNGNHLCFFCFFNNKFLEKIPGGPPEVLFWYLLTTPTPHAPCVNLLKRFIWSIQMKARLLFREPISDHRSDLRRLRVRPRSGRDCRRFPSRACPRPSSARASSWSGGPPNCGRRRDLRLGWKASKNKNN